MEIKKPSEVTDGNYITIKCVRNMAKVAKKVLKIQFHIENWVFNQNQILTIWYYKGIKRESLVLSKEELLKYLDKAFIIDTYVGDCVELHVGSLSRIVNLSNYLAELFGDEEALELVMFHEEQRKIKLYAKRIADDIQRSVKPCFS